LIHDLLEGLIGDLTPYDKNYRIKEILEREAIIKLENLLPEALKNDIKKLIEELLESKTKESQIVMQADKLDTAFQAYLYEKEKYGKYIENSDLTEFFESVEKVCKKGFSKELLDYIRILRGK
jgi:putative hydrolase of HD superfamily